MSFNIGINGFGRLVFRSVIEKGKNVVAINDPFMNMDYLLCQLRYDTIRGRFPCSIKKLNDKQFEINGKVITYMLKKLPKI